jgi:hypothetical protein
MGEIFDEPISGTTTTWEDNQSTIAYSHSALVSEKTKHIELKWHFLIKDVWNVGLSDCGIYLRTVW